MNAMPNDDQTRWTVTVSQQTDIALRTFLAQRGLKKGALSVFIEEAVNWRIRDLSRRENLGQDAELSQDPAQTISFHIGRHTILAGSMSAAWWRTQTQSGRLLSFVVPDSVRFVN